MKTILLATLLFGSMTGTSRSEDNPVVIGVAASAATVGFGAVLAFTGAASSMPDQVKQGKITMVASPILGLIISALPAEFLANFKEQKEIIRNDATLFIAGFEQSSTLSELIELARAGSQDLDQYSDEEIALALTTIE